MIPATHQRRGPSPDGSPMNDERFERDVAALVKSEDRAPIDPSGSVRRAVGVCDGRGTGPAVAIRLTHEAERVRESKARDEHRRHYKKEKPVFHPRVFLINH